jgi:hypothetical protein
LASPIGAQKERISGNQLKSQRFAGFGQYRFYRVKDGLGLQFFHTADVVGAAGLPMPARSFVVAKDAG